MKEVASAEEKYGYVEYKQEVEQPASYARVREYHADDSYRFDDGKSCGTLLVWLLGSFLLCSIGGCWFGCCLDRGNDWICFGRNIWHRCGMESLELKVQWLMRLYWWSS